MHATRQSWRTARLDWIAPLEIAAGDPLAGETMSSSSLIELHAYFCDTGKNMLRKRMNIFLNGLPNMDGCTQNRARPKRLRAVIKLTTLALCNRTMLKDANVC